MADKQHREHEATTVHHLDKSGGCRVPAVSNRQYRALAATRKLELLRVAFSAYFCGRNPKFSVRVHDVKGNVFLRPVVLASQRVQGSWGKKQQSKCAGEEDQSHGEDPARKEKKTSPTSHTRPENLRLTFVHEPRFVQSIKPGKEREAADSNSLHNALEVCGQTTWVFNYA